MKLLRWTWKVVTSLLAGCLASGKSTGTPERAKPSLLKEAFASVEAERAIELEKERTGIIDCRSSNTLSPHKTDKQKLDAAADALRQIECKCFGASDERLIEIGEYALAEWRKATK